MPRFESAVDRRREQHRHPLGLMFIPRGNEVVGVFENLRLGRALFCRFFFGSGGPPRLHLAAIEPHGRLVGRRVARSSSNAICCRPCAGVKPLG